MTLFFSTLSLTSLLAPLTNIKELFLQYSHEVLSKPKPTTTRTDKLSRPHKLAFSSGYVSC